MCIIRIYHILTHTHSHIYYILVEFAAFCTQIDNFATLLIAWLMSLMKMQRAFRCTISFLLSLCYCISSPTLSIYNCLKQSKAEIACVPKTFKLNVDTSNSSSKMYVLTLHFLLFLVSESKPRLVYLFFVSFMHHKTASYTLLSTFMRFSRRIALVEMFLLASQHFN